jgi:hypothetical protein
MLARRIFLACAYLALLLGGLWLSTLTHGFVDRVEGGAVALGLLAALFAVYVVFTAAPFVPGAEIGFGILMVLGAEGAALAYGGMILALSLAFAAGRFVPARWLAAVFSTLGLERARDLVATTMDMPVDDRARFIAANAPARWVPFLLRHRYLALAVLLNTPGNVVLGGGGGIAFAAGACRLFSTAGFLVTILIAVAPVPLAFLVFGSGGWFFRA